MTATTLTMRKDHRPLWLRRLQEWYNKVYIAHFIAPQCDSFGSNVEVMAPKGLELYGGNIHIGNHVHIQSAPGVMTRLATWKNPDGSSGRISVGDFALITAGVHIVSSASISIGKNVMLASHCYISDADWHDIYDRTSVPGASSPITLADNVWAGHGAKILKGVSIGKNTIIAAGAVVTKSFGENLIIAGCPAYVIGTLDPSQTLVMRQEIFQSADDYRQRMTYFKQVENGSNSFWGWVKSKIWPNRNM